MTTPSKVSTWAREVVAQRVGILTGLATVLSVLVGLNVIPLDWSTDATAVAVVVLNVLGAVVGVLWARQGTTVAAPELGPVSANGVPMAEIPALGAVEPLPPTVA